MSPHPHETLTPICSIIFVLVLSTSPALAQSAGGKAPSSSDFLSADKKGSASADRMFGRQAPPKDGFKEGWSGKGSSGLVSSTGNAENTSINLGLSATLRKRPWRHTINSKIYFAENDGERTAERYVIIHKVNYSMGDRGYIFNFLSYDADGFANIDSHIADVIGYGRTLIDNEKHNLEAELGLGFRQTHFTSDAPDADETVGHIGLNYTIRNNSDVPEGKKETDTVTSINVVSSF